LLAVWNTGTFNTPVNADPPTFWITTPESISTVAIFHHNVFEDCNVIGTRRLPLSPEKFTLEVQTKTPPEYWYHKLMSSLVACSSEDCALVNTAHVELPALSYTVNKYFPVELNIDQLGKFQL